MCEGAKSVKCWCTENAQVCDMSKMKRAVFTALIMPSNVSQVTVTTDKIYFYAHQMLQAIFSEHLLIWVLQPIQQVGFSLHDIRMEFSCKSRHTKEAKALSLHGKVREPHPSFDAFPDSQASQLTQLLNFQALKHLGRMLWYVGGLKMLECRFRCCFIQMVQVKLKRVSSSVFCLLSALCFEKVTCYDWPEKPSYQPSLFRWQGFRRWSMERYMLLPSSSRLPKQS